MYGYEILLNEKPSAPGLQSLLWALPSRLSFFMKPQENDVVCMQIRLWLGTPSVVWSVSGTSHHLGASPNNGTPPLSPRNHIFRNLQHIAASINDLAVQLRRCADVVSTNHRPSHSNSTFASFNPLYISSHTHRFKVQSVLVRSCNLYTNNGKNLIPSDIDNRYRYNLSCLANDTYIHR